MTLEDKWKKAEKNLEEFNKTMEIIKKYLPPQQTTVNNYLPYDIPGSIPYQQAFFWN